MTLIIIYILIFALPFLITIVPRLFHGPILLVFGILGPLVLLEVALRLGFRYDDLNWTPEEAIQADGKLTDEHLQSSAAHPHGFNDPVVSPEKPPGVFRIAVLGDSVIWGDGVKNEDRWSVRLSDKIRAKTDKIQVLHWGLRAWSTQSQVNFLKEHGAKWDLDYLLISYISNDPDVQRIPQKHYQWNSFTFPVYLARVFPNVARFIFGYATQLMNERVPGWGYDWWERELYSDENLKEYAHVVEELKTTVSRLNVPTTVVFVPASWLGYFREQFDKVIPLFRANGIDTLDIYNEVHQQTSQYPLAELRANRADGHPGPLMTEAYANIVLKHLKESYRRASNRELTALPD